jgi:tRNA1Val (adenine37-N6)-methyltransferase
METGKDETLDILCNGGLRIIQKKSGYRFSIDALLLANFVTLKKRQRLLDIGSGCGIIPIYMTRRGYTNPMVGIEIQEELHKLAVRNGTLNVCDNIEFIPGDVRVERERLRERSFDVIVSNPPFTREYSGRKSPRPSRGIARYESHLDLSTLLSLSSSLLQRKGRLAVIYPSMRLGEAVYGAKSCRLEPKRVRFVHPRPHVEANLVLLEFMKEGGVGTTVENPLYVYENGGYSDEVKAYYQLES